MKLLFGIPDGLIWDKRKEKWDDLMKDKDPSVLTHLDSLNGIATLNFETLLKTINERIEVLVDRDHTIGHAFFMNVKSLNDLRKVFANKVIPLLQEYFYGNYRKMMMVIGKDFFDPKKVSEVKFAWDGDDIDKEDFIYKIKNISDEKEFTDEMFKDALHRIINPEYKKGKTQVASEELTNAQVS